jgi:DNA repair protein RadD
MELRNYQKKALDKATCWLDNKITNPLIVLPTGAGKTVVFATLIQTLYKQDPSRRFLILAHRQELISQAEEKLLNVWPNAPYGVLAASLKKFNNTAPIIIASRDTLASQTRLDKSLPVDYIIIDEAHHVGKEKKSRYRKIINHFEEIGCPKILGVTATPYRMNQGFIYGNDGDFFDGVAHSVTIPELMEEGYLCRLTAFAVAKEAVIDASKARLKFKGGDYRESDLEVLAMDDLTILNIIDDWVEKAYSKGRTSTVFFCVSVLHAEKMCMLLRRSGITSAFITAETPKNERNAILKQFEQGKINALCNVAVLTEGWDAPRTDCIAILRPTKSLGLYVQICGRGMRPWPGKEDCLLLDYGENMKRHGCIDKARPSRPPDYDGSLTWVCGECFAVNDYEDKSCVECEEPRPVSAPHALDYFKPGNNTDGQVSASDIAAEGYVLSDEMPEKNEPIYRSEDVIAIRAKKKTSKNGNDYLSVEFQCDGVYWPQSTALMIGMKGKAGDMARIKWNKMTGSNKYPYSIDLAVKLINEVGVFDKIKQVNLKKEGKYWNVIGVNF